MKRKNILKFISLLGVGSFVALSAASCKTEKTVKPTKPTEPKNPNNGGGTTTTNPPSTGGDTSTTNPDTTSPGGSTDGSNTMTPSEPTNSKKAVETYVSKLTADSFKLVDSKNAEIANDSIKASEVTKENIKLKENNPAIEGWTLDVELVSNSDSSNSEKDSIKFKAKFSKDSDIVTSSEFTISGFKTLKSSIASVLLKNMTVKNANDQEVTKKVLDLGNANFEKLSTLNEMKVIATPSNNTPQPAAPMAEGATVREDATSMENHDSASDGESNQEHTTGLGALFKTLANSEESVWKEGFSNIKKSYPDFKPENLYLSGQAKLVSLWKTDQNDWQGNYYLTSKDADDNKLSIKYKDKEDLVIELNDGLVLQNLLPDDVRISASIKKEDDKYIKSKSNIEAYKTKIMTEKDSSTAEKRYELSNDGKDLKIKITVSDKNRYVYVNPIKLPFVGSGKTDKILFKSEYIFDGIAISDTNFFGTKLIFKKIHNTNKGAEAALDSSIVNNPGNGVGAITGKTENNITDWKTSITPDSNKQYFFSEADSSSFGFDTSIHGQENSEEGNGIKQLIENNINASNSSVNSSKINDDNATTFLIFSRVAYKKDTNSFGYYWPNSITILYFAAPSSSSASATHGSTTPSASPAAGAQK
ncbi:lipoprotein 17-related variable surface protein [Mycoplasma bradburyae]|uniref:lipoprotein 17-related variable surface protein n=1 Tax=Mycoplasma bradburyae TaxID=2963128 RepID=UPI0020CECEBD|nr:lipoprotein 17-related variable surface protein [Mycoplasma bradburyae]UTS70539.1 lipoprotein 17-related variable surface protein [Mycoplasma bradburyae]